MDADLIRLTWALVDKAPLPRRRNLTMSDRIGAVLSAIDGQPSLSSQQRQQMHQYLVSRQHLLKALYR